jgi:wyosine [tRNA(Phe)-imidazoG37] synthetase (radical SAM superfamily)
MQAFTNHSRQFQNNYYVYPVLSRRSRGVSIGVNINHDQVCNFRCLYCQVDRTNVPSIMPFDADKLARELHLVLELCTSQQLFQIPPFDQAPPALRRLNDIALSGDGEPTISPHFLQTCQVCAQLKASFNLPDVKIIVITNATRLQHPEVMQALSILDDNNGEVWAKLDAGTEPFYRGINCSAVSFEQICRNITACARQRSIIIQTLFFALNHQPPSDSEIAAYIQRLEEILHAGGSLKLIQLHTIARDPHNTGVLPLADVQLDRIAGQLRARLDIPVELFYAPRR